MVETTDKPPTSENLELVVLARTDRTAFGQLCDLYYPRIFRHCRRRLFHWDVAEELTAEVFLTVARTMRRFPGQTHDDFLRWSLAIATNQINAYVRKSQRRTRLLEEAARRGALHVPGESVPQIDLPMLEWSGVFQALLRLTPRDQSIIALRYFEQMTHRQIADILEMQPGAVRTAETRALDKLRRDLGVER